MSSDRYIGIVKYELRYELPAKASWPEVYGVTNPVDCVRIDAENDIDALLSIGSIRMVGTSVLVLPAGSLTMEEP